MTKRAPAGGLGLLGLAVALSMVAANLAFTAAPSHADDDVHHVRYTVVTDEPTVAEIYYRDTDPPNFADYSHNPYEFSPKAEVPIGPKQPWVLDVMLANPDQWAMVVAGSRLGTEEPTFHCQLAVDGTVIANNQGPKGALCSLRNW